MKIVLLSNSDCHGGAAVVTRRLTRALIAAGADASMLVLRKGTDESFVHRYESATAWLPFYLEHGDIFIHNGLRRKNLFSVSTGKFGVKVENHPLVKEADVVILGWVNQGFVSLNSVQAMASAGKKIVWIMHDLWNATALCHHSGDCSQWKHKQECVNCPLLPDNSFSQSLTHSVWHQKKKLYSNVPITFIAVSSWLRHRCAESTLMQGCRVETLPNVIDSEFFSGEPVRSRKELGLPEDKPLVLMCAARLDDPVKGLPDAIRVLNSLPGHSAHAVMVGALKNQHALDELRYPYTHLGSVSEPDIMADIFRHSAVVLSTSSYETLPTTLIEGQAGGAWPVSYSRGGQSDIISDGITGSLVSNGDIAAAAAAVSEHLHRSTERTAVLKAAADRFAPAAIIPRLMTLIN